MINIKTMTVLIAEDVENMFNSIRNIMRLCGFGGKFLYAPNGEDALKILREIKSIELLICDNNMPVMTGIELLKIIRNDMQLRDMPVVMITAHAEKEFVTNAAESEIDAYLLKPITVKLLKDKIPPVIENANNPSPMFFHLKAASAFAEEGDIESAIEQAMLAKNANPKSSRPLREIGNYFFRKDDLPEAEKYLTAAASKNSIDVVAFHYLADVYLKQNRIDDALKYLDKAMKISPLHFQRGLNLARILIQRKMDARAEPVINKVLQVADNPLQIREEMANLCIDSGSMELAVKFLKDIIKQKRNRWDLMIKLAIVLQQIGRKEEALSFLINAERLNPEVEEIKFQLAGIYLHLGMPLRAEKPLQAILEIDPENKRAKQLMLQCI